MIQKAIDQKPNQVDPGIYVSKGFGQLGLLQGDSSVLWWPVAPGSQFPSQEEPAPLELDDTLPVPHTCNAPELTSHQPASPCGLSLLQMQAGRFPPTPFRTP